MGKAESGERCRLCGGTGWVPAEYAGKRYGCPVCKPAPAGIRTVADLARAMGMDAPEKENDR